MESINSSLCIPVEDGKDSKENAPSTLAVSSCVTEKTAESTSPDGITAVLHHRDLWMKFHKCTTEMIITKAGRYVGCVVEDQL